MCTQAFDTITFLKCITLLKKYFPIVAFQKIGLKYLEGIHCNRDIEVWNYIKPEPAEWRKEVIRYLYRLKILLPKNAYFNIRNISKLRNNLDKETVKTAVNALVTPHLDYGNALLYGINSYLLDKLQVAQNSAVRLIEKLKKYDHVSSSRQQLHWLPIPARIHFKLMMTTWKAINKQAPIYIQELIKVRQQQNHNLRSNNKVMLESPSPLNKNKHEERAFSFAATILWNPLQPMKRPWEKERGGVQQVFITNSGH